MSTFTVKAASHKKDVQGQYGPMKVIALMLSDGNGTQAAEWFTKAETPLPAEGSTLEGELQEGNYGLNFKKSREGFGGGGGGGMTPERQRAIQRQHSQDMALRALELAKIVIEPGAEGLRDLIVVWADWFDNDVNTAAGVPAGGGGPASPSNNSDPSPVAGQNIGFRVKEDGTSPQKDYFESLLKKTSATTETRGMILLYAETLPNVSSLIDLLKEGPTADVTARQLAAEAREWEQNQPNVPEADTADLPEPEGGEEISDDDGIPF